MLEKLRRLGKKYWKIGRIGSKSKHKAGNCKQNDGARKKNENANEKKTKIKRQLWSGSFELKNFEKVSSFFHFFIIIFSFFYHYFFIFLSLFFHFFYHFLQVKSQFCSRSSLNAGKTEEAREKTLKNSKNWEQIKAQSWKLQAKWWST